MNNITYLDTSALNYLADNLDDFDLLLFWRTSLKVDFCISEVVIWEILLNSNSNRKEELIYWAQFNCADYLLKSPSELFINYLKNGCPQKDKIQFWNNRETENYIGKIWNKIHGDETRTLPVDLEELKARTEPIRYFSKKMKAIVNDLCNEGKLEYIDDTLYLTMHNAFGRLKQRAEITHDDEKITKLCLIFVYFFVCIGLELDTSIIQKYWKKKKIEKPFDRFDWLISHHHQIVLRGPILEMAKMAEMQFIGTNTTSRGLLHDCFHSVYCYYADNLLSDDEHFNNLKKNVDHPAFQGIIMACDFGDMWNKISSEFEVRRKDS